MLQDEFYFNKHGIMFITICPGFTDTAILDDLGNKLTEGTLQATLDVKEANSLQTYTSSNIVFDLYDNDFPFQPRQCWQVHF